MLWSLVINERCVTLETFKDLKTVILPYCLRRHDFKIFKVFYFDNMFAKTFILLKMNENQVFSRFCY